MALYDYYYEVAIEDFVEKAVGPLIVGAQMYIEAAPPLTTALHISRKQDLMVLCFLASTHGKDLLKDLYIFTYMYTLFCTPHQP